MPKAVCKLCLKDGELQKSHLIPSRAYIHLRSPENKGNPDPLMLTLEQVKRTSKQAWKHLLCKNCEDLLSRGGEQWVLPRLAAKTGFILRDVVEQIKPTVDEHGMRLYPTAAVPEIAVDKLVHFAMGIFWKASVAAWGLSAMQSNLKLGPYQESLRKFLLGETPFPEHIRLLTIVAARPLGVAAIRLPVEGRRIECRTFNFLVPGLAFMLFVGKIIPEHWKARCFYSCSEHPILMADLRGKLTEWMNKALGQARISQQFQADLKTKRQT
jgi:hypothetical protein